MTGDKDCWGKGYGNEVEAVLKEKFYSNGKCINQLIMSLSRDEYLQLYPEPILEHR